MANEIWEILYMRENEMKSLAMRLICRTMHKMPSKEKAVQEIKDEQFWKWVEAMGKCGMRVCCEGRNDSEIVLAQKMHKNDSACVFAIERTKVFHKLHQFAVVPRRMGWAEGWECGVGEG